jgi:hypothetical protein
VHIRPLGIFSRFADRRLSVFVIEFLLGRRAMKQGEMVMGRKKLSPQQRLREKAEAFKRQAEELPYGRMREELLLRARRLETASHIGKWISSPGLSPPT